MALNLKIFPLHAGIWEGTYTRINENGEVIDKHKSRLTLALTGNEWRQVNKYTWENGKQEKHDFGVSYFNDDGLMTYNNHRIIGKAWETTDVICLEWQYIEQPGTHLYEIITLIDADHRMRTWQHSRNGVFEGITMIEERRVQQ